ncbi:TrbI/VirB10 family protein [Aliivibrio salmonicida]|uniref:TrbI/VirB10 family protein n=1 Tax=Aliivibrio salmonicida TaxID=40269 RepID=UPI003D0DD213
MMDEDKKEIEPPIAAPSNDTTEHKEETVDNKKKGMIYFGLVFGGICLLFLLNTLNKEKADNTEDIDPQYQPPSSSVNTSANFEKKVFDSIVTNRPPAAESTALAPASFSDTDYRQSTPRIEDVGNYLQPDIVEQEKKKHQALETKRAQLSTRSTWGLTPPVNLQTQSTSNAKEDIKPHQPATLPDEFLSSDEQRAMIARRLQQADALKQRILKGDTSTLDRSQLSDIEASFSEPPSNIVGFTKENTYNASTEGRLKLPIGTLIPAITIFKTNSDYSGSFKATVSQDVFDISGEYVLIPKGAQVILKSVSIGNVNEPISSRMGITVPWIVLPNGNKIDMSKSSGLDREGISALGDEVDRHLMAQFFGVAAYALVGTQTSRDGSGGDSDSSYLGDIGESSREQVAPLAQKYLSLKPTITLRAGQSMNIMIEEEVFLSPWRNIYEDYL